MSTDFRALCAELLESLENAIRVVYNEDGTKRISTADPVIAKARAALAQPEPVVLTRPDCFDFAMDFLGGTEEAEVRNYIERLESTARAALVQPEPVPVAERLPGPEDCDAEGECWWWHPDHKEDEFSDGWMLLKPKWADGHHDADDSPVHTHWLPHHTLPVPQQEVQ